MIDFHSALIIHREINVYVKQDFLKIIKTCFLSIFIAPSFRSQLAKDDLLDVQKQNLFEKILMRMLQRKQKFALITLTKGYNVFFENLFFLNLCVFFVSL